MVRVPPSSTRTVPSFENSPLPKVAVLAEGPDLTIVAPGRLVNWGGVVPHIQLMATVPVRLRVPALSR